MKVTGPSLYDFSERELLLTELLAFHSRQCTYKRKSEKDYDRMRERARRSFYKWVCKEGLYGKLYEYHRWVCLDGRERVWYKREYASAWAGGTGYSHGYPVFNYHRSYPMDMWEAQFKGHQRAWKKESYELDRRRHERWESYWKALEREQDVACAQDFFSKLQAASAIPASAISTCPQN